MPQNQNSPIKIVFTGGGTAGHIFPVISIIRQIKEVTRPGEYQFFYIGPKDDFVKNILAGEQVTIKTVLAGKMRRYLGPLAFLQNIVDIFIFVPLGFFQALFYNFLISPDIIFSKGGYGSLPAVLSGWLLLIPVFLHESDIIPGLANRILSRFSSEIFTAWPVQRVRGFPLDKMIAVGNPIRPELLTGNREMAKDAFKLAGGKPLLLTIGGSQGSQRINDILLLVLPELLKSFELIHQVGNKNVKQIEAEAKIVTPPELQKFYHAVGFLSEEDLAHVLNAVDFVISRAGAGSIFEISAAGKPSILIPLPESAQQHQLKNAYAYAESGAALVIEESNFTSHFFLERIRYLFSNPQKLKEMSQAAKNFSKPNASKVIAEYLINYLSI